MRTDARRAQASTSAQRCWRLHGPRTRDAGLAWPRAATRQSQGPALDADALGPCSQPSAARGPRLRRRSSAAGQRGKASGQRAKVGGLAVLGARVALAHHPVQLRRGQQAAVFRCAAQRGDAGRRRGHQRARAGPRVVRNHHHARPCAR